MTYFAIVVMLIAGLVLTWFGIFIKKSPFINFSAIIFLLGSIVAYLSITISGAIFFAGAVAVLVSYHIVDMWKKV